MSPGHPQVHARDMPCSMHQSDQHFGRLPELGRCALQQLAGSLESDDVRGSRRCRPPLPLGAARPSFRTCCRRWRISHNLQFHSDISVANGAEIQCGVRFGCRATRLNLLGRHRALGVLQPSREPLQQLPGRLQAVQSQECPGRAASSAAALEFTQSRTRGWYAATTKGERAKKQPQSHRSGSACFIPACRQFTSLKAAAVRLIYIGCTTVLDHIRATDSRKLTPTGSAPG